MTLIFKSLFLFSATLFFSLNLNAANKNYENGQWVGQCSPSIELFAVSTFQVSPDSEVLEIIGVGLDNVNSIKLYSPDMVSVSHTMSISSKTAQKIEALPNGSNLILIDGSILNIE